MTKKETLQILAILKAAYPNTFKDQSEEEASGTVGIWFSQFADTPAEIVMMAVHKLIAMNKFPPTIAEVKSKLGSMHWEAYGALRSEILRETMPPQTVKQFEAVYEATRKYENPDRLEPGLGQMITLPDLVSLGDGAVIRHGRIVPLRMMEADDEEG